MANTVAHRIECHCSMSSVIFGFSIANKNDKDANKTSALIRLTQMQQKIKFVVTFYLADGERECQRECQREEKQETHMND